MFERENLIGFLLLALCAAVAGLLVYSLATGTSFDYTGPAWLGKAIAVVFVGIVLYGLATSRRRWPHPLTGHRGWRPWHRRKDE